MISKIKILPIKHYTNKLALIVKSDNCKEILYKTIFGMNSFIMIRHYLFAIALLSFLFYIGFFKNTDNITNFILLAISTLLYPYARFAYEYIVKYILGDYIIFSNIIILTISKFITMFLCLLFSIFIAPIGLILLYWENSKK